MRKCLFSLFLLCFSSLIAQKKYPQNIFSSPLDIPLILSGTFGELRSNHFHSGIDIKTQNRQGLPIYAIQDGTVTRIKISLWGYGKVLYVAHPNGYTSVYAHLKKFNPEIEAFIKAEQYKKKSYEVEVFPDFGELAVKKEDIIAYSGNTGGSSGPHLHFEIRNSVTEKPVNPLLYGYDIRDFTNPTLVGLYGYPLSNDAQINKSAKKIQLNFTKKKDGSFLADKIEAQGTIGFGFKGFDRQDLGPNKNGVYAVKQIVNGKVYSEYNFETFSFGETRYINTLIDYQHYGKFKQRIQKCFKDDANKLSIYKKLYLDGKIPIEEGISYTIELLISDIKGNNIKVIIPVEGVKNDINLEEKEAITKNFIKAAKSNSFDLGAAKVYFPKGTFYNDFYIDLKKGKDTITIHNETIAAHRNFTLTFDVSKYSKQEQKQFYIARLDKKLKPIHYKTYKKNNTFSIKSRNLGSYTLVKDTLAPKVKSRNFKDKELLTNYKFISLEITDDLSGIKSYSASLNGKWILMEYEPKLKTLTYNFDDTIKDDTKYDLKVIVTDNVGCLLYTSPSPRDQRGSRMPSSA